MIWIVRIAMMLVGLFMAGIAAFIWSDPVTFPATLGISQQSGLGMASIRADLGAFFGTVGLFALAAGLTNRASLATPPLVLVGLALAARGFSYFVDGPVPGATDPMIAEGVMLVVFTAGWAFLGKDR